MAAIQNINTSQVASDKF